MVARGEALLALSFFLSSGAGLFIPILAILAILVILDEIGKMSLTILNVLK